MPTLSSLLVQRGVAPMRAVEEAIARQVLRGGDLVTNLLELGTAGEEALTGLLAESLELAPAPGRLHPASVEVLRTIPVDLAVRHSVFPLALRSSTDRARPAEETLLVATSERLAPAVEDDLSFALGVSLEQVAAPLVRICQGLAEHYGVPLDGRFLRLVAELDGGRDRKPSSIPPVGAPDVTALFPRPITIPAPTFGTGVPDRAARAPSIEVSATPPRSPAPAEDVAPLEAPAANSPPPDAHAEAAPQGEPGDLAPTVGSRPANKRALAGWLRRTLRAQRLQQDTAPQAEVAPSVAPEAAGELGPPAGGPAAAPRRAAPPFASPPARRKGPFTAAMAEEELTRAGSTDEVLEILFAFAHQYFEYTALFVVHGDLAEGRMAAGPGADRDRVARIGVPLDLASALSTARARRAPVIAALSGAVDADLRRDLDRARLPSVDLALIPVVVRSRVVALLYGDDGVAPVELSGIGGVLALAGLAATTLERLILKRKLGRAAAAPVIREMGAHRSAPPPEGPLSARTRAELLELTGGRVAPDTLSGDRAAPDDGAPDEVEPDPTGAAPVKAEPDPTGAGSPGPDGHDILPGSAEPEGRFDALARAFGLRGTGVEVDPGPLERAAGVSASPSDRPAAEAASSRIIARPRRSAPDDDDARQVSATAATLPTQRAQRHDLELTPPDAATSWTGDPALDPGFVDEEVASPHGVGQTNVTRHGRRSAEGAAAGRGLDPSERRLPAAQSTVDMRAEYASLLQDLLDGGDHGERAFGALVRQGEAAIQVIVARFPGPMRVDRHRVREHLLRHEDVAAAGAQEGQAGLAGRGAARREGVSLPPASECGPILELLVAIGRPALPFMTVRSASHDAEVRFWATHVLGELLFPEAANALLPRLFEDDVAVRRIARRSAAALVAAPPAGAPILQGLGHMARDLDESIARRIAAVEAMGEIRAAALIPTLLAALRDPHEPIGDAAAHALALITREDLGRDFRKWGVWWAKNADRHRVEWLIDALTHERATIRRAASDELKALTKEYLGYYDDLPRKERESAQERYRAWWAREGRSRFGADGR